MVEVVAEVEEEVSRMVGVVAPPVVRLLFLHMMVLHMMALHMVVLLPVVLPPVVLQTGVL